MKIKQAITTAATAVSELVRGVPIGPQIADRLSRAEQRREALRAEANALALDVELGEPGAADRHRQVQADLDKAEAECVRLQAAFEAAAHRDYAAASEERVAEYKAQLAQFERVLVAHQEAAGELDAAVEALAHSYRRLQASSELLRSTAPLGLPNGYIPIHPRQLLGHQLHRVSGAGSALGAAEGTLPGAHSPTIQLLHRADGVETASQTISAEVDYLQAAARRTVADAAAALRDEQPSSTEEAA